MGIFTNLNWFSPRTSAGLSKETLPGHLGSLGTGNLDGKGGSYRYHLPENTPDDLAGKCNKFER